MLNILVTLPQGNGFSRSDIHKLSNSLPQEAGRRLSSAAYAGLGLACGVRREDILVPVSFLNALFYLNTVK